MNILDDLPSFSGLNILATVDAKTFSLSMYLIIGLIALLVMGGVFVFVLRTIIKVWQSEKREHESWELYGRDKLGPDGVPYPPCSEGICEQCGRGDRRIYHAEKGPALCPTCYDQAVRQNAPAEELSSE